MMINGKLLCSTVSPSTPRKDPALIKQISAKSNRCFSSPKKKLSPEPKPSVEWNSQLISFKCPNCKSLNILKIITLPITLLTDKNNSLVHSMFCNTCHSRNEIRYKLLNNTKKIKLIEFKCKGEDFFKKARRTFKVLDSN